MLNIFFISNDVRVARLIEYFQPRFRSKIRRADNFDQGLKEVFEKRPSLVFIQNSINSVSGETVARHIKSLLGSGSPLIVYLDETGVTSKKSATWCDAWMRIGDSEQVFQDEFAGLVARLFPEEWKEDARESGFGSFETSGNLSESDFLPDAGAVTGKLKKNLHGVMTSDPREGAGESSPARFAGGDSDNEIIPAYQNLYDMDSVAGEGLGDARRGKGLLLKGLLLFCLVAAAAGAAYFLLIGKSTISLPSKPEPESAKTAKPAIKEGAEKLPKKATREGLPAFIRSEWRDPAFSSQNPGWERYVSSRFDFRIFRDGGLMKALQIIALNGQALSGPYLLSVLRELGFSGSVKTGNGVAKDGFLMETATLDGFAEMVAYRENDGRMIRALVLVFP